MDIHAAAEEPMAQTQFQPRIWVVLGDKQGDNSQVETIEKALQWTCERKYIQVREPYVIAKPRVAPSLHHIDLARSDPLEPPWPDLIITIGRRPSMVALWIREQSKQHTKIVLVGKPSGRLEYFDLIITSAEAQLPPLPNVLPITLPLMRVNEAAIAAAVETWQPRLAALPRPLIAFLIGGPTGPFIFDTAVVDRLIEFATEIADGLGGTPYITTSRRTPAAIVDALSARLPPGTQLFHWFPGCSENPYFGLLGLADGFIVTGDSISMLVEITRLRKPLAIFPLPLGRLGMIDQLRRSVARALFAPATRSVRGHFRQRLANTLYRLRILTQTRDFKAFHQLLIEHGLATGVGQGFQPPQGQVPDDLPLVLDRIKALIDNH